MRFIIWFAICQVWYALLKAYERASNALERSFLLTAVACFITGGLPIALIMWALAHAGKLHTSDKLYLLVGGSVAYIVYMIALYFVRFRKPGARSRSRSHDKAKLNGYQ